VRAVGPPSTPRADTDDTADTADTLGRWKGVGGFRGSTAPYPDRAIGVTQLTLLTLWRRNIPNIPITHPIRPGRSRSPRAFAGRLDRQDQYRDAETAALINLGAPLATVQRFGLRDMVLVGDRGLERHRLDDAGEDLILGSRRLVLRHGRPSPSARPSQCSSGRCVGRLASICRRARVQDSTASWISCSAIRVSSRKCPIVAAMSSGAAGLVGSSART
jgi:hypothetical protein